MRLLQIVTDTSMMAFPTTMLVSIGPGRTTRLNLDAHKHLLSLLQSNFAQGQFGFSQNLDQASRHGDVLPSAMVFDLGWA